MHALQAVQGAAAVLGGVSLSMTLAACYGSPCATAAGDGCGPQGPLTCEELSSDPAADDTDGDGYCLDSDCDETDATINAAAYDEPDDGIDQDCSGADATTTQ